MIKITHRADPLRRETHTYHTFATEEDLALFLLNHQKVHPRSHWYATYFRCRSSAKLSTGDETVEGAAYRCLLSAWWYGPRAGLP